MFKSSHRKMRLVSSGTPVFLRKQQGYRDIKAVFCDLYYTRMNLSCLF